MARGIPSLIDTVIVGNGPSALILSYIFHGHIPIYDSRNPHPDPILHEKLKNTRDLLNLDVDSLTEHFTASRFSYSTQALPINVLLDTLIRPLGETDDTDKRTCVKWQYEPERIVPHVVIGNTSATGGQWVDNPVQASWDIGTLSYAGMLSLPGYSFQDHYEKLYGKRLPPFSRPTRREVANYLAEYPVAVGIEDSIRCGQTVSDISRLKSSFFIGSHEISCKHLVLSSGIFSKLIPPRPLLQPLLDLADTSSGSYPMLIVGSGFSAADVIISTQREQKIIHVFKWKPSTSPSPLRACNSDVYPDYVEVYRKMKLAALSSGPAKARPRARRTSSTVKQEYALDNRYEGLPNTVIVDVKLEGSTAVITLQSDDKEPFQRRISGMSYVVGRRGSLTYLAPDLVKEVCKSPNNAALISGQTLRERVMDSNEIARDLFVIGSLTGDSLIRFAYGGCTATAGKIMRADEDRDSSDECCSSAKTSRTASPYMHAMNGLDGHLSRPVSMANGELGLDRRKGVLNGTQA